MPQLTREPSPHTGLIAVGFVGLGLPAGALGAAWPSIEQDLNRRTTDLTIVLVCFAAGYFVFGAIAGAARRRLGATAILVGAAAAPPGGLLAIAIAPSWPVLLVGARLRQVSGDRVSSVHGARVRRRPGCGSPGSGPGWAAVVSSPPLSPAGSAQPGSWPSACPSS